MSQGPVTQYVFAKTTKDGKCVLCGCQLKICLVCDKWFRAGQSTNEICSPRCRTKKHRDKIKTDLDLDDE